MVRFLADTVHVNPHRQCEATTGTGHQCESMTNQVCTGCDLALCGRHEANHMCMSTPGVR